MQSLSRRLTYLTGFLGVMILLIASLITAVVYVGPAGDHYSPFNHVISELGHTADSRFAPLFNLALFLSGLCFLFFLLGVAIRFRGWLRPPLVICATASGLLGALIGVFPMNVSPAHFPIAIGFFSFAFFYILIFSLAIRRGDLFPRRLADIGLPALASSFLLFITGVVSTALGQDNFIPPAGERASVLLFPTAEWLALLSIIAWVISVSLYLRQAQK